MFFSRKHKKKLITYNFDQVMGFWNTIKNEITENELFFQSIQKNKICLEEIQEYEQQYKETLEQE